VKTLLALLAALTVSMPALADPPGRVGRIAYLSGNVSLYADPQDDWQPAVPNWPVTSQNSLWTDTGARAEVRIGAVSVRLDGGTQADFRLLDDVALDVYLPRGTLGVHLSRIDRAERYIVSTPEARFYLSSNGRYRVDADVDLGESRITVFAGSAQLDTPNGRINVEPGKAMRIKVANGQVDFLSEYAAATPMDQWALARDEQFREAERALEQRQVSPAMTGYEDLNSHGDWVQESGYGTVWYPRVDAGWVPYRYGRWGYVRPWGWTWIDDAPWGFAPFHYGRWAQVRGRWCWYPGAYAVRPYYAPALVSWFGGSGWAVSATAGAPAIGWSPLGPRDYYRPWYGHSSVYVTNINNVTFVDNGRPVRPLPQPLPAGQRPGATVVLQEQFAGRPIGNAALRVSGEAVARAPVVAGSAILPPPVAITKPLRVQPANAAPALPGQPVQQKPVVVGQPVSAQGAPVQPAASVAQPMGKPIRVSPQAEVKPVVAGTPAAAPAQPSASVAQPMGKPVRVAPQAEVKPVATGTPAATPAPPAYVKPARVPREERQAQQGEPARTEKPASNREPSRQQSRPASAQTQAPDQQHPVQSGGPAVAKPQAAEKVPAKPKPPVVEGEPVAKPGAASQAK
jgi:hypothetical protein